jgi:hypothetical protein
MGPKATTTNFYFWPSLQFFFCLPNILYEAKHHKPSKSGGQVIKNIDSFAVPKSPSQMASLSVKNLTEKISRLGTLKLSNLHAVIL